MPVRVVIAEDEWLLATQLCIDVESHGYQVVGTAKTGTEAVEMCWAARPDVVLMDIRMPELDGIEATRRVMQARPTAIAMVTGDARLRGTAREAGAMGFATKPLMAGQIPWLVADSRERFACFMAISQGAADLRAALDAWLPAQEAAELLMAAEAASWKDAFQKLQQTASDRGAALSDVAREVVTTSRSHRA